MDFDFRRQNWSYYTLLIIQIVILILLFVVMSRQNKAAVQPKQEQYSYRSQFMPYA